MLGYKWREGWGASSTRREPVAEDLLFDIAEMVEVGDRLFGTNRAGASHIPVRR
jgi:hypothetical protein